MIIKRKQAKSEGLTRYFTGKPCINGHISERNTKSKSCMACRNAEQQRWRDENRERVREWHRRGARKYREAHPVKWTEVYRAWREINADKARQATRSWRENNKDAYAAYQAHRRSKIRKANVELSAHERKQIRAIYLECARTSAETGVLHHVDHVVPLAKGGPHHPSNLRIITALENMRKGDRT